MTFLHGNAARILLAATALLLLLAGGALLHTHLIVGAEDDDAAATIVFDAARDSSSSVSSSPSATPAPAQLCNHTIQGRAAVADDGGRLCNRSALDVHGCCSTDELDSARCNASGAPCFQDYEVCVCCCIREAQLNFEWCASRCRTSGSSPLRNCYKTAAASAKPKPSPSPRPTSDYFEWKKR